MACLRAWLRADHRLDDLRLAAHLGLEPALLALGVEQPQRSCGGWLRGLERFGAERCRLAAAAFLEQITDPDVQPHLGEFAAALRDEPENTLRLFDLYAALRPSSPPPSLGAFNPTGTSDFDDVAYAMAPYEHLYAQEAAHEGVSPLVAAARGERAWGEALEACYGRIGRRYGLSQTVARVREELLSRLELPHAEPLLDDPLAAYPPAPPPTPTQRAESPYASARTPVGSRVEGVTQPGPRLCNLDTPPAASARPRSGREPERSSGTPELRPWVVPLLLLGLPLLACLGFQLWANHQVKQRADARLAKLAQRAARGPLQLDVASRSSAATPGLELELVRFEALEATLRARRLGRGVKLRFSGFTILAAGERRYLILQDWGSLDFLEQGQEAVCAAYSLDLEEPLTQPQSATLRPPRPSDPLERRACELMDRYRRGTARTYYRAGTPVAPAELQLALVVALHDPPRETLARRGDLTYLLSQLRGALPRLGVDPETLRAFRK